MTVAEGRLVPPGMPDDVLEEIVKWVEGNGYQVTVVEDDDKRYLCGVYQARYLAGTKFESWSKGASMKSIGA